jgi:hypothetical protein
MKGHLFVIEESQSFTTTLQVPVPSSWYGKPWSYVMTFAARGTRRRRNELMYDLMILEVSRVKLPAHCHPYPCVGFFLPL